MTPMPLEEAKRVAAAMRADGATYREIGAVVGRGTTSISHWLNPERKREAQRRYRERNRRPCAECGELMSFHRPKAEAKCPTCLNGKDLLADGTKRRSGRRSDRCGVPGCAEAHLEGRYVCAEHAPLFDRIRTEFQAETRRRKPRLSFA